MENRALSNNQSKQQCATSYIVAMLSVLYVCIFVVMNFCGKLKESYNFIANIFDKVFVFFGSSNMWHKSYMSVVLT